MEHSEVREILEDAAIEPGGLDRLMAGDTPNAALVAGHLAGCPDCGEELERLRRSVGLIRPAVRDVPPPELRARTLAYVAAVGRPRGTTTGVERPVAPPPAAASARPVPFRRASRLPALAGIAAALLLAVTGTALVTNANRDGQLKLQAAEIDALGDVARWTLRIDQQPDARRVALTTGTASMTTGELTFSPGTSELVVVADGLTPPAAGTEYRCWVQLDGKRTPIGKMFFGGDVAYWVGPVPSVSGLPPAAAFGVSLIDLENPAAPGRDVLTGTG